MVTVNCVPLASATHACGPPASEIPCSMHYTDTVLILYIVAGHLLGSHIDHLSLTATELYSYMHDIVSL